MGFDRELELARDRPDDIIAEVLTDHIEIKELFEAVSSTAGEQRDDAFRLLVRKLVVHEVAEQEILHPLTQTAGGDAIVDSHLHQEKSSEVMLSELEAMGVDHAHFDSALGRLRTEVLMHADNEERNELPLLDERIDADMLVNLAPVFRAAEDVAPTHPHPHSPTSPLGNAAVGPIAAFTDLVRDAIRTARRM